jgi:prepilin-type N-terminal cleavage/methylation domain-containing protein
MRSASSTRSGFTLVELSIVLVITALLVGGLFVGKTMVRAAELRSVMTDATNYLNAINTFRTQYKYLPGDMPNATNYWGGTTTNGNLDGQVLGTERFRAWQHLSAGGMVEVTYSGVSGGGGAGTNDFIFGTNTPRSRIADSGFAIYYSYVSAGGNYVYDQNYGNMLTYGGYAGVDNGPPVTKILTPADATSIDQKSDDGKPGTGKWIASSVGAGVWGDAAACTTSADADDLTGDYRLSNPDSSCSFFIKTGY